MLFRRQERREGREFTARQAAAFARSCRQKQERLPLFAEQIAEGQRSLDEEIAYRAEAQKRAEAQGRGERATLWREVRARLYALPGPARRAVLDRYHGNRWFPREPGFLAGIIWDALRAVPVTPDQMKRPTDFAAQVAALNDRARQSDKFTRSRFAWSPGAMRFLCPDFVPDEDHARPRLHLHTNRGWFAALQSAVRHYGDWSHNTDPTGERCAGVFRYLGVAFRFEVIALAHNDDAPSAAPWNLDLSRRIVWVGLEDETADLEHAAVESGWRPGGYSPELQTL